LRELGLKAVNFMIRRVQMIRTGIKGRSRLIPFRGAALKEQIDTSIGHYGGKE
jgi:hypothetical protein